MAAVKKQNPHMLTERIVRNDDLFVSLLFDHLNKNVRVVDFRGGNFQTKHAFIERIMIAEGMRKITTLVERDDANGWQRMGYIREGSIAGYYKRSDAYVMSKIYDEDWTKDQADDDTTERKNLIEEIKELGTEIASLKGTGIKAEQIIEEEVESIIVDEYKRLGQKPAPAKKKTTKKKTIKQDSSKKMILPLFPQFSREVDNYYLVSQNRRTKQTNVFSVEYQDCFSNGKIDFVFSPTNRSDRAIALMGMQSFIEWLDKMETVAVFSLVPSDDIEKNAIFYASNFRLAGWLNRHHVKNKTYSDLLLWTRKLIV